ncbi:MAG: MATE family efflux transporter [Treponema sp.]|jgi:putative MATE family efflux protein|nr:MATE family efflux transporter [Treponema sp.]
MKNSEKASGQGLSAGDDLKYKRMTESPVESLVCRLAVPSILIMLISALYNMADTYFVGSLGTNAVASVGIVFPLMAVIQALGFLFGQGSGNYISRELGAKRPEEAAKMAATSFFMAVAAGIAVAASGLVFLDPLAAALGSTEAILPYTRAYMRFILIGAPWMAGSLVLNNQLRFQGSAVYAMAGMISGAVLNIILDPVFIFALDLGVAGAAIATAISQFAGCAVLLAGCSRRGNLAIRIRNITPSWQRFTETIRGGLPSLLRQGMASIAAICVNHFAKAYGAQAIAAISIVNRVTMFCGSALIGFGQGFQPVCGYNYGAKLYGRVKKAFWFCVKFSFLILLVIAAAVFIAAPQIIAIFRKDDPEVIRIGALSMRLQALSFPLTGWVVLSNMFMQTIGKSWEASLLSSARQGLILLPLLFTLAPLLGLLGIQISQPISDAGSFILAIPLMRRVLKEMRSPLHTAGKERLSP